MENWVKVISKLSLENQLFNWKALRRPPLIQKAKKIFQKKFLVVGDFLK